MDRYLTLFLWVLTALCAAPVALTQILFCASNDNDSGEHHGRTILLGTLLNLIGNGLFGYVIFALLFHTRFPWTRLWQIVRLRGSYQGVGTWAMALGICILGGVAGGHILRLLFRKRGASHRGKEIAFLIAVLCFVPVISGVQVSYQSVRQLSIQEVFRKTSLKTYAALTEGKEESSEDVSIVVLYNPGRLSCEAAELWLSENEDDLRGLCFQNIEIPAQSTLPLVMDYNHGVEIRRNGGTTVYVSVSGEVIDSVVVPALEEDESYARVRPEDDDWVVLLRGKEKTPYVETPGFSLNGGFYDGEIPLELSAPAGLSIYYTLDGSDPTAASIPYTEPILLVDRSAEENVWSSRTDVTAAFIAGEDRFAVPENPVDKCMMVRAICVDDAGNESEIVTQSYFIGYQNRTGYDGIKVASIVTDPKNLFDEETGIYVLGNVFRDQFDPKTTKGHHWWPANYHQKGRTWEREADIQFFDTDQTLLLTKKIGIRIKGGASAGLLPKGLNLYARKDYDGVPEFLEDFFDTGYSAQRLALSGGGNDVYTKAKDWLMSRLAGGLDVPMYHYEPCHVFLDGEYWGVYMLTECFDSEYFSYYYDVPKSSVVIIKKEKLKRGTDADLQDYMDMVAWFRETDMSIPENYEQAGEMIDIDNCQTYFALEIYCGNTDWREKGNIALWRVNMQTDDAYGDGRWRWALFDVNHGGVYSITNEDYLALALEKHTVFRSLMQNEEFKRGFYEKMKMLAEDIFAPEKTAVAIAEYEAMMKDALDLDHQRFYNTGMNLKKIDDYQTFFVARAAQVLRECEENLRQ